MWWNVTPPTDPFIAAFSFLTALPREEAAAALRNRATAAAGDGRRRMRRVARVGAGSASYKPTHVAWMFELSIARTEGEIAWCERIAEQIESGVSYLPASLEESPEFRAVISKRSSNNQA